MGMNRNIRNTVKAFKQNPKEISFRLISSMFIQLRNIGVTKEEIKKFCEKELDEIF